MSKKKKKKSSKSHLHLLQRIEKLLEQFSNQSFNYKQIAKKLETTDKKAVNTALEELIYQEKVKKVGRGKHQIQPTNKRYYIGTIDATASGNAYFICDELEEDVYIPHRNLSKALHQDIVKVYVYKRKRNKRQEGDVIEIIKQAKNSFVGVLQMSKNFGFVLPDDPKMYADIFIPKNKLNNAKHGDKVQAIITDWPEKSKNPFGKITEVLGKPGDHNTEMHSILVEYGLPYKFPDEIEQEASKLPIEITKKEIAKRRDMRDILTFTIDPKDAKDFDDAISFQVLENGNYEVGIHIADVSHYIKRNTLLDEEAYKRATSVYLVDRVVPMLPEILSNGVCSLRPKEEKLTFSAVFEINDKAEVLNEWFGRTVTYSDQRFTYEEAQEIIESKQGKISKEVSLTGKSYQVSDEITKAVLKLDELAKKMRKKRIQNGAITFERSEVKFELDKDNEPIGVYFKESKDANKLIEELMLLANRKVAEFIGFKGGKPTKKTFIYRIHDEPDTEKLASLQKVVSRFGYTNKINTQTGKTISNSINKLLSDVNGKGEANMISTLAIRSMSKAVYSTQNIGHYGLAFDYYSHFTSPIRRYPDVMTHRLLQHYLDGGKSVSVDLYEEKCKHSSDREQLATSAERDSTKYMQVKYMEQHKNQLFEGVISGVTEWGIYVEIIENKCEGMVRIREIKDDYYIYDEEQYALVGQSTKNLYQLGDNVIVKVKKTDLERKHLDFTLIEKIEHKVE